MAEKTGRAEATHRERAAIAAHPLPAAWPQDADGNYLAIVSGAASDLVPTVQFGNVLIGPVTIQRPVAATSLQEIVAAAQETQKAAEFVVGTERRLLQWALDPASKVRSPVDGSEAFSAPPAGVDPTQLPQDPRTPIEAAEAAQTQDSGASSAPASPEPSASVQVG